MCNWLSGGVQIPNSPFHVKPRGIPNSSAIKKEKVLVALHRLGSSRAPAVCTGRKLTYEERVWIKMSTLLSRQMMAQHLSWRGLRVKYRIIRVKCRTMVFESACFARAPIPPTMSCVISKTYILLCEMKLTHLLNHAAVRIKVDVSCEPAKRDCYLVSPQQKLPSNHAVSMARKCRAPGSCVPGDRPSMCSQERFPRKWHLK